jgi:hypothetical protein
MESYLSRYERGEREAVWRALVDLGEGVRDDAVVDDARAVAAATMKRAHQNVQELEARLKAAGYIFVAKSPHAKPALRVKKTLDGLEGDGGILPLSLRAFYETVGSVDFRGTHPDWALPAYLPKGAARPEAGPQAWLTDPLVVEAPANGAQELEMWLSDPVAQEESDDVFTLAISPDDLHKANISGGAAYELAIPNEGADFELENAPGNPLFVDYLKLCFAHGGLPGFAKLDDAPKEWIAALAKGLLPL